MFTVLIPARYASTRLPGKPLADIAGKPMVVRVAERARQSGAARVVVATDDARVVEAVRTHGFEAIVTREDHPTGTDRLAEAAAQGRLGVVQSIRGRVADLGGRTTIVSAPGEGTEVEMRVSR